MDWWLISLLLILARLVAIVGWEWYTRQIVDDWLIPYIGTRWVCCDARGNIDIKGAYVMEATGVFWSWIGLIAKVDLCSVRMP